jgi:hypothetical protein
MRQDDDKNGLLHGLTRRGRKRKKENVQWPPHGQENVEKSVVAWSDNYAIADG